MWCFDQANGQEFERDMKLILFLVCLLGAASAQAQVAVIANGSVHESSLTQEQFIDVCLQNVRAWSDGTSIQLFFSKNSGPEEDRLFAFLHRTRLEMRKIWLRAQLSGHVRPPEVMPSVEDVLRKVESTPGALGVVDVVKVQGNVKVLLVIE